jgi:LAO/AO transport system kinase
VIPATIDALASGGKNAMAAVLARIEEAPLAEDTLALLEAASRAARAHVVGITGAPGVGKSTLSACLIRAWRRTGEQIGVIAVDPSSKTSGGALLGDRLRLAMEPDPGLFIRSMAARDRLGGLAPDTVAAAALMRAVYDRVLIETVGVGQSETDIAVAADTVLLCLQPGSGDLVQFMKAGIVEVPDVIGVTKADLGSSANRTLRDARAALEVEDYTGEEWKVPILATSASAGIGIEALLAEIERHRNWLASGSRLIQRRHEREQQWLKAELRHRFGTDGLARLGTTIESVAISSPFSRLRELSDRLLAGRD